MEDVVCGAVELCCHTERGVSDNQLPLTDTLVSMTQYNSTVLRSVFFNADLPSFLVHGEYTASGLGVTLITVPDKEESLRPRI